MTDEELAQALIPMLEAKADELGITDIRISDDNGSAVVCETSTNILTLTVEAFW